MLICKDDLVVGNPKSTLLPTLPHAEAEAQAIADILQVRRGAERREKERRGDRREMKIIGKGKSTREERGEKKGRSKKKKEQGERGREQRAVDRGRDQSRGSKKNIRYARVHA